MIYFYPLAIPFHYSSPHSIPLIRDTQNYLLFSSSWLAELNLWLNILDIYAYGYLHTIKTTENYENQQNDDNECHSS